MITCHGNHAKASYNNMATCTMCRKSSQHVNMETWTMPKQVITIWQHVPSVGSHLNMEHGNMDHIVGSHMNMGT
jgi:hypothetical protein